MNQECIDVFSHYELPFETYFLRGVDHLSQIHDETELIWILRGNAEVICDGITYLMTPQTLFMVNAYQSHTISSSPDAMIITYRFKKEHLLKNNLSFEGMNFVNRIYTIDELVIKYKEVPLLVSQLMKLLISKTSHTLVRYKIIGYYNMLIYELYTMLLKERYLDVKKKDITIYLDRLNSIVDYLNKNFLRKITLEDISNHIGLSTFRLSHFIKDYVGISFRDYLSNMRLEYALRLLRDSDISVIDISKMSGFSDVKYLNKLLKEKFKITALKYRKRVRERVQNTSHSEKPLNDFFNELKQCLVRFESRTTI